MEQIKNLDLPQDIVQMTYVWIGGNNELRSKSRTLDRKELIQYHTGPRIISIGPEDSRNTDTNYLSRVLSLETLPKWDFDGSSTGQASGTDSEVILHPVSIFRDPFRPPNGFLVMCATYLPDGTPHPTNKRDQALRIFKSHDEERPWFGLEQEFFIVCKEMQHETEIKAGQQYYCSVGAENVFHRDIMEAFYRAVLYAGVKLSGINAEVVPHQ